MTKTDLHELLNAVRANVDILEAHSELEWARALEAHGDEAQADLGVAASRILRIFGAMGSYNDVVLYKGGQPLKNENDDLSAARERLFNLCLNIRQKAGL